MSLLLKILYGTEEELDLMNELFTENVSHPNCANLFFYPEDYNAKNHDLSKCKPTFGEVVDRRLNYMPIQL